LLRTFEPRDGPHGLVAVTAITATERCALKVVPRANAAAETLTLATMKRLRATRRSTARAVLTNSA